MTETKARLWSTEESRIAAEIWQREFTARYGDGFGPNAPPPGTRTDVLRLIAAATGRTVGSARTRFHDYGPTFDPQGFAAAPKLPTPPPSPQELKRRRRAEALARRDLTAAIFNDPPPGYSALDAKMGTASA